MPDGSRLCLTLALFVVAVLTAVPALGQIAPGVVHSAAHTANITGTVTQSNGAPVAGANIRLIGPALLSTKSDPRGNFSFQSVPWGTYEIIATSALGTASRGNVILNGDINVAIQYQVESGLKTIARVSTAGAGAHINVTSSSVSSVSPNQYAFQGNATWTQLFAQVPGVAVSGSTIGGINPANAYAGAPQAPVILSINGALPYETSTTLDGMPLGASVDLSTVPLNAFDTADIVRGPGANAPSIVDSVSGTFVLHPPEQVNADHFEFSASNDPYGGIVSNAEAALHFGRLSATFIYGVNDSPGPLGMTSGMPPFVRDLLTIDGQNVQASPWSTPAGIHGISNCYCVVNSTLMFCCVPQTTAWTAHSGAVALSYEITPSIRADVFYAGLSSNQNDAYGYQPVDFAPSAASPPYSGSLSPSPPGQSSYTNLLYNSEPSGSIYASSLVEEKVTAYLGRGVLRLAAAQFNTYDSLDYSCLGTFGNGEYRVWGTADVGATSPGTPTAFNGTEQELTFLNQSSTFNSLSHNRDLLGSYDAQVGPASSIGVSYVTSYNDNPNTYSFLLGGTSLFSAIQSPAVSETTHETRVNFNTDVSDRLSLGLSWYFAEATYHVPALNPNLWTDKVFPYSAPRFGAVWQANPNIAIRVAVGGGYALPAIGNLTGASLTCATTYCNESIANPSLKPEETFAFDVGTDMRFHRETVLSFDLYRTNLYGQFYTENALSTFNGLPLYLQEFGNIATSRMEGINLDIHHDVPFGYYWRTTLGFTRGYVVSVPPGFYNNPSVPCTNCVNQTVIPGVNFNSVTYSATVPYASASAQLGYRWSPAKYFDLSATYYGNNNIYLAPNAFVELDAHAGYAITRDVSLLAMFRNITGAYDQSIVTYVPPYATPTILGATGYWPGAASATIPYGPRSVIVTFNYNYR